VSKILIVDDECDVRIVLEDLVRASGYEVATEQRTVGALERLQHEPFDLVIFDISTPGMDGLEALRLIHCRQPLLPVIIVTGEDSTETAIQATQHGAFDYQLKPFQPDGMLRSIRRALAGTQLMKGRITADQSHVPPLQDTLIGSHSGMQDVYKAIGRVAGTDIMVLICGESGTGKELVARAIHRHSLRREKPLLVVNCAAIPEPLLEGELFGYERGAFTGAVGRRIGKFEQADQGTIFLDEIGDAPLSIQAKILRVLQEKTFERLGGDQTIRVDVRVLTATNQNLAEAIAAGIFRADLFHRLNVVSIHVPPLRERREDIPRLADYFLTRFAREMHLAKPLFAQDAYELLLKYAWPGNVRELEHCIRRAVLSTRGYPIQVSDLVLNGHGRSGSPESMGIPTGEGLQGIVRQYLDDYRGDRGHEDLVDQLEKTLLAEAVERAVGNRTRAAQLLGLPRGTFLAKLQKYGLQKDCHR